MLRRRKRIFSNFLITKPLTSHHLLHSDKSTYFYKNHHHTFHPKSQGNAQVGITKLSVFSSRFQVIPLAVSVAALLGLGVALVNPLAKSAERVYAEDTSELNQYSSIAVSMSNSSLGELTGDETVSAKVTPGLISYIDNNIKITTKRINQFYVTVQAAENSTSELVGEAYNATIDPIADGVKPDSFSNNTWGYTIGDPEVANEDLTYHPLTQYSAAATPLYTSASNLADGEYNLKLVFAAKINANKPGDHYKTSAIVSVAADAKQLTLWDTIEYMQDMKTDICKDTHVVIGSTRQLKDKRDNKYYWIAKLADGNCWMTQNLDFDVPAQLNTDGVITSDINEADFTTNTTKVTAPNGWSSTAATYNAYYDPGDYIYNGPDDPAHGQSNGCNANNSDADALAPCSPQFSKSSIDNTNAQVLGDTNRHYHVGNYYSFSAATVKSGDSLTNRGDQAADSICPKGWELPKSGNATNTSAPYNMDKTFAKLFESYSWKWDQTYYANNLNGGTSYNIYATPFYFTYGGSLFSNMLRGAGSSGCYWSPTVISGANAFYLNFGSDARPVNNKTRYDGSSVRCVAR